MTVFVYLNTSKQVDDAEHVKVYAPRTSRKNGLRKTTPKASPLSTRSWNEPDGPQDRRQLKYGPSGLGALGP